MSGKCVNCSCIAHQGSNGKWYCMDHHPQRICAGCKQNVGRYLVGSELCQDCQKAQDRNRAAALLQTERDEG